MTATADEVEADTRDRWRRLRLDADRLARIEGLRPVLRATEDESEQLRPAAHCSGCDPAPPTGTVAPARNMQRRAP